MYARSAQGRASRPVLLQQNERGREQGKGHRERENLKQTPDTGLDPTTPEIMT